MARGDEEAYRRFYDAYFNRLSRYLLVIAAGNEELMREALQGTLVRVVHHIKPFRDESQFWAWLTVLARSAFTDETRRRSRYRRFLDRFTPHAITQADLAAAVSTEHSLEEVLNRAMALLPAEERALVEKKYLERKSVRELATELNTSEKAVESRLVRIRAKVREAVSAALEK